MLLRLDFQDFFPAFPAARVHALFRTFGYPEAAADRGIAAKRSFLGLLGQATSGSGPGTLDRVLDLVFAPASAAGGTNVPALANLMTYRLDCRLSGLARSAGAVYTRYADDVAFSGDGEFERSVGRFKSHAAAIALEEGFAVNHHKTRVVRRGVRHQLAGVVVNEKVNLARRELELLEAILTNCMRRGPESQNRAGVVDLSRASGGRGWIRRDDQPREGPTAQRATESDLVGLVSR